MKKLIIAICAIAVTVTAVAQYSAISCFGFDVRLDFDNGDSLLSTIVGVQKNELGVQVMSQVEAEVILSNLNNLSEVEVCSIPVGAEAATYSYNYRADNLTDAVKLLIKAIKAY